MDRVDHKMLIFEYWFTVFIGRDIFIVDITKIAVQFAQPQDMFVSSLTYGNPEIEDNGKVLCTDGNNIISAYGIINAGPDEIYHWRVDQG